MSSDNHFLSLRGVALKLKAKAGDAAIHLLPISMRKEILKLDCFATLAMTNCEVL